MRYAKPTVLGLRWSACPAAVTAARQRIAATQVVKRLVRRKVYPFSRTAQPRLRRKHLAESRQQIALRGGWNGADAPHEPRAIYGSQLIEHDLSLPAAELALDAARVQRSLRCRHRRNDDRVDVAIQFIRRNDDAWPRFSNLAADRGVEVDEVDLEAPTYHSHSVSSNEVGRGSSSRRSSPRSAIARKASSQP